MQRHGNLIHLVSATVFVASSVLLILFLRSGPDLPATGLPAGAPLLADDLAASGLATTPLPLLFLDPGNVVMWALLLALWAALMMDAVGQWFDPSDTTPDTASGTAAPVWPLLSSALLLAALWPWLMEALPWLAVLAALATAAAAFVATLRAEGQRRPAIGFLAGWSLGLAAATLAERLGAPFGMTLAQTAMLAILPATGFGMAAQLSIGRPIGFSVGLIWAFCGLATTTMGFSPMTAVAAILGIALMATVLIRAAS